MFVTFEGIEGAGKSTVMAILAENLKQRGSAPLATREPGGSGLGRMLRSILLDSRSGGLANDAELYLFLADRAQHVHEVIKPALEAGQTVFCDRYVDSTIAYQGYGRGKNPENLRLISTLTEDSLMPDMTLLLDLPVIEGLARAGSRNRKEGTVISEGRFDSESLDFHGRVRNGYLALASRFPERITVINADQPLHDVVNDCQAALDKGLRA